MAIGIVLDFALEYTLEAVNAPDFIRNLLSPMAWIVLVVLGVAITITSIGDAVNLAKVGLKNSCEPKNGNQR